MNKKFIFSAAALLLLAVSCSNDDNNTTVDGKVNAAKAIEFKVDFADYNAEQEVGVTRANKEVKLEQQTVDLGNGVLAQCTLQRDTTKQTKPADTRALANDTYTMLAYDAATHAYKGDITGTVTGGVFTPTSTNQDIGLVPGTYDFVLFNSKVTRSGNNLTVTRANADAALIGRAQQVITATPKKQQVPFTMKHVGAKVKVKLTGRMDFPAVTATLASVNATDVPASSVYDASTGTWTAGTGAAVSVNTTYAASTETKYVSVFYTSTSNEETMFTPATDVSKLKLTFNSGSIYRENMANASLTFKPTTTLKLEQNGAYVLNVTLMYNFLYLMSDGSIGGIRETTYGGAPTATAKTPIAIVLSRSNRMAMALHDAGSSMYWCTNTNFYQSYQTCTHMVMNWSDALNSQATSGLDETWDANYSTSRVIGNKIKGANPDFLAFKAAADYDPGVAYTGSPALKWYLPSYSDFKWMFSTVAFGDKATVTHAGNYSCYWVLADFAISQVGGSTVIYGNPRYWTSTELKHDLAGCVSLSWGFMNWGAPYSKNSSIYVRPFVKY